MRLAEGRFGVSWQFVPEAVGRLLRATDRGGGQALLGMRKIDIAQLETAFRGEWAAPSSSPSLQSGP